MATFRNERFYITDLGKEYAIDHGPVYVAITKQSFPVSERQKLARREFKNVLVEEGQVSNLSQRVYQRSRRLIEFAKQRFADDNGRIVCRGCKFEGSIQYGQAGLGLIEIHHLKPLYLRDGRSEVAQLIEAVAGVAPLCPNCHRLVHRDPGQLMTVEELRQITG